MREPQAYEDGSNNGRAQCMMEPNRLERIHSAMRNEGPADWQIL